jgi:hypothetical protein
VGLLIGLLDRVGAQAIVMDDHADRLVTYVVARAVSSVLRRLYMHRRP